MISNDLDLIILKSLISNKKNAIDFVNNNDSRLFSPEVWNFANLIIGYIKTYKDVPTLRVVTEKLSKGSNTKLIENVTTIWSKLDQIKVNDKEFKHDLESLKKRFAAKQILSIKDSLNKSDASNLDIDKTLSDIQKTVQNIQWFYSGFCLRKNKRFLHRYKMFLYRHNEQMKS